MRERGGGDRPRIKTSIMTPAMKKSMLTAAMADWDGLPQDVLGLILKKTTLIEDFIAIGMVCKSWHMAFASNKSSLPRHQNPWLMLPEKGEDHYRRIFSLSKQNILPKIFYVPELYDKRCIGLNYGWVLAISSGGKGEMSLVHPLSRSQIELPPQKSVAGYDKYDNLTSYMFRRCGALSANPFESPSDFILMILHSGRKYLGYWRPGDREWTRVVSTYSSDLTYYQDQFYAITYRGVVWSYKVSSHGLVVARQVVATDCWFNIRWPYIVGNAGTLLVLTRHERMTYGPMCPRWDENYAVDRAADFQVYELDLINSSSKPIKNIGDKAIFVGCNTSISLDRASHFPGVKSNHIYYTDDRIYPSAKEEESGKVMGSYNIQNGLTMPFQIEESSSLINPPFWFIPN